MAPWHRQVSRGIAPMAATARSGHSTVASTSSASSASKGSANASSELDSLSTGSDASQDEVEDVYGLEAVEWAAQLLRCEREWVLRITDPIAARELRGSRAAMAPIASRPEGQQARREQRGTPAAYPQGQPGRIPGDMLEALGGPSVPTERSGSGARASMSSMSSSSQSVAA